MLYELRLECGVNFKYCLTGNWKRVEMVTNTVAATERKSLTSLYETQLQWISPYLHDCNVRRSLPAHPDQVSTLIVKWRIHVPIKHLVLVKSQYSSDSVPNALGSEIDSVVSSAHRPFWCCLTNTSTLHREAYPNARFGENREFAYGITWRH